MKRPEASIKTLFIVSIIALTGILLTVQTIINVRELRSNIGEQVKISLSNQAQAIAGKLDQRLLVVGQKATGLALSVSELKAYDIDVMFGIADGYIKSDSLIIGSGFWFEPHAYSADIDYFGPYHALGDNGNIELTMEYSNAEYGYTGFDWYKNALANPGTVAYTGPYLDDVSGTTMLTTASAISKGGRSAGTVSVDIGITELEEYVQNIKIGEHGYAFLVSQEGYYLATSDAAKNMKAKITEEKDPELARLGQKLTAAQEVTLEETDVLGEDSYVMAAPLAIPNMKLVLVAPYADYDGPINRAIFMSILMALAVMIILCAAMIAIFNRRVGGPVAYLMEEADKIAAGDLRSEVQVATADEMGSLGNSLRAMSQNLKKVIKQVRSMSEQVAAASEELNASAGQSALASDSIAQSTVSIAEGASNQAEDAKRIQETASEATLHAREIADRTRKVTDSAAATRQRANEGREAVREAVSCMGEITESTDSIQHSVKKLADSSKQIADIVNVVTGIAEQTNLLSLNAAIEAARAGEAGRGFAVVADEVRKLAEAVSDSSKQIAELVKANQADMESAVQASETGAASVQRGIETVRSADEVFGSIVGSIDELTEEITGISQGIDRMAEENDRMLTASQTIAEISNKNSDDSQSVSAATEEQTASVQEIAEASRNLARLAADLQGEVGKFKL